ncbi:MAG: CHASE3 domain-containing protein [Ferruginibacter sp.]
MGIYSNNRRLYYLGAGISLMILVIFGVLYLEKSRDQVRYIDEVEHTYKVLSTISFCEKALLEAEGAQRGYILTQQVSFIEDFEHILPSVVSSLKEIARLAGDNSGQKVYLLQLTKLIAAKMAIMNENILMKAGNPFYFENLRKGAYVMENCRFYMKKLRDTEEGLLKIRLARKQKFQRINLGFFRGTFITFCVICIIATVIFFRELGTRLSVQKNLRAKVNELSNRKRELEEITFVASHDLQEPMRKVRILSSLMIKKFTNKIPEPDLEVLHRIDRVTGQMHGLLNDLVTYTNLLDPNEKYGEVNLYDVFKRAYNKLFENENIQFQILEQLPVITGSRGQLEIMLVHLLDNANKFRAHTRDLNVVVKYELTLQKRSPFWRQMSSEQFHKITLMDNGIGFDEQYNDKIFGLFQRLHTQSEYPGKGIGLAIARRVMANHKGTISAISEKNKGTSFILLFPMVR